jgi:hypothetical protein
MEATVSRQHEYGMRTELIGPAEAQRRAPLIERDPISVEDGGSISPNASRRSRSTFSAAC